jgi:hypothetical protein
MHRSERIPVLISVHVSQLYLVLARPGACRNFRGKPGAAAFISRAVEQLAEVGVFHARFLQLQWRELSLV